jgi:hypothetical protein
MTGVDNRLGERLGRFLRHVVTDRESPVLVLGREIVTVKSAIPGRGKRIVFTINGDRGNRDGGSFLQPVFDAGVFGLTQGLTQPPAVITDYDTDVIRVGEGSCRLIIGFRRVLPGR